jgi:peptide/nickel transport system permease protein
MAEKDAALTVVASSLEPLAFDHSVAAAGSGRSRSGRALLANPLFWTGGGLAAAIVALSVLAPVFAPHDPTTEYRDLMPLDGSALPPSAMFPLGTDVLGRDYLSRLLYAGRTTLFVGLGANVVAVAIGILVGMTAGFAGTQRLGIRGRRSIGVPVDGILMRITDIGLAFPALLLAIVCTTVFGRSLTVIGFVIAAVLWTTMARLVYGRTLIIRQAEFVTAAQALGCSGPRIVGRHLLPHILPLAVVYGSLGIAATVLFEASLSYLGAGAPTKDPTWGRLLADHVGYYATDPRLPFLPALAIFATVLAFNLVGDALRDALDPHAWR